MTPCESYPIKFADQVLEAASGGDPRVAHFWVIFSAGFHQIGVIQTGNPTAHLFPETSAVTDRDHLDEFLPAWPKQGTPENQTYIPKQPTRKPQSSQMRFDDISGHNRNQNT
jgi:hypothetical protein